MMPAVTQVVNGGMDGFRHKGSGRVVPGIAEEAAPEERTANR